MVNNNFQELLKKGRNVIYANQRKAIEWYKNKSGELHSSESVLRKNRDYTFSSIQGGRGHMFLFNYVPKHKDTLPIYDLFPLCIPFRFVSDGFYGINLHYLDYKSRALIFDQITTILTNNKWDESTRINLTYQWVQKLSSVPGIKDTVKRYLSSFVRSRFMYVPPLEWETALFMPFERFVVK